jgi:hypothetical protein
VYLEPMVVIVEDIGDTCDLVLRLGFETLEYVARIALMADPRSDPTLQAYVVSARRRGEGEGTTKRRRRRNNEEEMEKERRSQRNLRLDRRK